MAKPICDNCGSDLVKILARSIIVDNIIKTFKSTECLKCGWKKEDISDFNSSDIYRQ